MGIYIILIAIVVIVLGKIRVAQKTAQAEREMRSKLDKLRLDNTKKGTTAKGQPRPTRARPASQSQPEIEDEIYVYDRQRLLDEHFPDHLW